jgi:hypothetical protein
MCALTHAGSVTGTTDFFCCPRLDSPSVFASLLDADRGGHFSLKLATSDYVTRQLYFPDTAMLITRFMTADGVGEVLDFMPVIEGAPTDRHRIVRKPRVACGTMNRAEPAARVRLWPRPAHDGDHRRRSAVPGRWNGADGAYRRQECRWCGRRDGGAQR